MMKYCNAGGVGRVGMSFNIPFPILKIKLGFRVSFLLRVFTVTVMDSHT